MNVPTDSNRNDAFLRLGKALGSARSRKAAALALAEAADQLFGWDACVLALCVPERNLTYDVLEIDTIEGKKVECPIPPESEPSPLQQRIMRDGAELVLKADFQQPLSDAKPFGQKDKSSASLMFVPFREDGEVIGLFTIQSYHPNAYTPQDLEMLQSLCDYCGGAFARLHAQEASLKSELQLRLVWENTLDGMRLIDGDSRIVAVNQAFCRLARMEREDLIGKPFVIIYAPTLRENMLLEQRKLFQSRTTPRFAEAELPFHDGRKGYAEVFHSILDVEGQPPLILSVFRDITERKQIEKRNAALSKLAQNLASAVSPSLAAQVIRDIADELFGWDSFAVSLCSPDPNRICPLLFIDTIEGRRIEIIPSSVSVDASEWNRRILQNGAELKLKQSPITFSPGMTPFGDKCHPSASIMAAPIRHGSEVVGMISVQSYSPNAYAQSDLGLLQSIADQCGGALNRIRAETAFKASESRFRSVWDNSVDGLRLTDERGLIVAVNHTFCRLVGMERGDLEGRPLTEVFPPDEHNGKWLRDYEERFQRKAEEGQVVVQRLTFRNGRSAEVEATTCFVEVEGEKTLLLGIFRDVSDQRRLQEQLRQSQKMESIGKLAGGIAHDFNNLLTVIQGHAALLLQAMTLPSRETEHLRQIADAADRSANLTRQLLTYSRRQYMQRKSLNMADVVNNMTQMLRRILGEDILLLVSHARNLPPVHADQGMMEQLLLNFCVNSRDAMPGGGELIISTDSFIPDEACKQEHPEGSTGHFLRLTFKDSGCGIPSDVLPHIFEPFFTTKEVGKGTGMGLATVYGIVKQHGGWIAVASTPGNGATFEVFLPAGEDPSSKEPEAEIPRGARRK